MLGWRAVPVDNSVVGPLAKMTCPVHEQILVDGAGLEREELERKLFIARKTCEKSASSDAVLAESFYICTLSSRTIVYKGMLRSAVLGKFYKDWKTPTTSRSSRFTTAVSPRTRRRSGRSRNRCVSWDTTVRSTPFKVT